MRDATTNGRLQPTAGDDGACVPRGGAARPLPPTTGLFRTATPALPLAHARSHIKARTLMQTRADVRHTQRRAQSRTHSLTCPRAHSDTQTDTQTRKHADTHPHGTSHAETRVMPLETHIDKCHCVYKRTRISDPERSHGAAIARIPTVRKLGWPHWRAPTAWPCLNTRPRARRRKHRL